MTVWLALALLFPAVWFAFVIWAVHHEIKRDQNG